MRFLGNENFPLRSGIDSTAGEWVGARLSFTTALGQSLVLAVAPLKLDSAVFPVLTEQGK